MGNGFSVFPTDPVTSKVTERGQSDELDVKYAVSAMKGLRHTMEDQHIHSTSLPVGGTVGSSLKDHAVFAVFDGHGGGFTSEFLKENFLKVLAEREELAKYSELEKTGDKSRSDVNGIELLRTAVAMTFLKLDQALLPVQKQRHRAILEGKLAPALCETDDEDDYPEISEGTRKSIFLGERSGATGVVCILTPSHFICANAGDSRAILQRKGQTIPMSFDHKPSNVPERVRILEAKGTVKGKRVDGDLAVSRAFGDFSLKENPDLSAERQKVICIPDIHVYPRNSVEDEFLVLACDGVWDVATNSECSEFVQTLLSNGETDLGTIAEEALDTCLERNSRDNMTLVLIALPAIKAETDNGSKVANAIWGHRTARRARQLSATASQVTTDAFLNVADVVGIDRSVCV